MRKVGVRYIVEESHIDEDGVRVIDKARLVGTSYELPEGAHERPDDDGRDRADADGDDGAVRAVAGRG